MYLFFLFHLFNHYCRSSVHYSNDSRAWTGHTAMVAKQQWQRHRLQHLHGTWTTVTYRSPHSGHMPCMHCVCVCFLFGFNYYNLQVELLPTPVASAPAHTAWSPTSYAGTATAAKQRQCRLQHVRGTWTTATYRAHTHNDHIPCM